MEIRKQKKGLRRDKKIFLDFVTKPDRSPLLPQLPTQGENGVGVHGKSIAIILFSISFKTSENCFQFI